MTGVRHLYLLGAFLPMVFAHTTTSFFNTLWQMPAVSCRDCLVFPVQSEGGFRTQTVPCAAKVVSMQLLTEGSGFGTCRPGVSYGFYGARAWADRGCKATFRVCFDEGTVRSVKCESERMRPRTCSLGSKPCNRIESISITTTHSNSPCIKGFSYTIDRQGIHVSKGCRATFQVGCKDCGIHARQNHGHGLNLPDIFNDPFRHF